MLPCIIISVQLLATQIDQTNRAGDNQKQKWEENCQKTNQSNRVLEWTFTFSFPFRAPVSASIHNLKSYTILRQLNLIPIYLLLRATRRTLLALPPASTPCDHLPENLHQQESHNPVSLTGH
jgi:hypothetical protein